MDSNIDPKLEAAYLEIDKKVKKITQEALLYLEGDKEFLSNEIWRAYEYAKEAHHWLLRKSWEPYIIHPVEATKILLAIKPDLESIQTCFLHDVIEDTPKTYEDILEEFGPEVAKLCEGLVKVSNVKYKGANSSIDTLRKMFVSMAEDIRVIFVKLADRIHNMQTIKYHPVPQKREKIAKETLDIYTPIAERLGLYKFKDKLEEECFKTLDPKEYDRITSELKKISDVKDNFKKSVEKEVYDLLKDTGIKYELKFRVKSIYSIYRKTKLKGIDDVSSMYDLFGIRIITDTVSDCYAILGYIHNLRKPIPKRIKDYIALSKPNGYQSLHTTIIGFVKDFRRQPTEIQIRTHEMHRVAEYWIAAHYQYKEHWSVIRDDFDWVQELRRTSDELENDDLMHALKIDVFKDRIFVFTPNWDVLNLPAGSTPIDFAYAIHSDIWNHAHLAKVNWKVVPINSELSNWDHIEIILDKNRTPNPMWISFVKTAKARNKIKSFLQADEWVSNFDRWIEVFNRYLEKLDYPILDDDLSLLNTIDWKKLSKAEKIHLIEQVWMFNQSPSNIFKKILKESVKIALEENKKDWKDNSEDLKNKVIIGWEDNIPYSLGKCCKPSKWDKVVAYVTSRWSITIHRRDCFSIENAHESDRLMPACWQWQDDPLNNVSISFFVKNKVGSLKAICDILFEMQMNIVEIHSMRNPGPFQRVDLTIEIYDSDYLMTDTFIERVKSLMWDNFKQSIITKIEDA